MKDKVYFILIGTKQDDKSPTVSLQRSMVGVRKNGSIILMAC